MTWATELAKSENDALRQAGDIPGILAKYGTTSGDPVWRDIPFEEVFPLFEASALAWSNAIWTALRTSHIDANGDVTFTSAATRSAIVANVTAEELEALKALAGGRTSLAESLGLNLRANEIREALQALTDSPQYAALERSRLAGVITAKWRAGGASTTSLANLATIETLIGV